MKDNLEELINVFKALSDRNRLRIMMLLITANTKICVCEMMDSLQVNQYNISRHLKILKQAGLVQENKEGRWVYYSVAKSSNRFQDIIFEALAAFPQKVLPANNLRLKKRLSLRKNGKCVIGMNSEEWFKILAQLSKKGGILYV